MVADKDSEFSSPFDAMLDQDRKRLDQLYRGPAGDRDSTVATSRSMPFEARRQRPATARPTRPSSNPARALDEKFGDGWRHEVVERRHDGDEVVVRCRLTVADHGIDLTRSGRARIDLKSERPQIVGSADGIPFSFRSEDVSGAEAAEEEAIAHAVAEALAKCVTEI